MKSVVFALSTLLLATGATMAADMQSANESVPVASWFGYVEGGYVFRNNTQTREEEVGNFDEARTGDGGYGAAKLGYRINDAWDVATGFRYLKQSSGRENDDQWGWQFTSGRYWNADIEVGYHLQQDDWALRPFAGLRYQHYGADFHDNIGSPIYFATETSWGIGPRVGMDISKPLGAQLSFFGSADASVLFGKIKADRDYGGAEDFSESRTFATLGLKAGLAWEFAPGVKLGAGYQLEYLSGVGYKSFEDNANSIPAGSASQFTHGPFARISFNY